jgi:hypothetical protein
MKKFLFLILIAIFSTNVSAETFNITNAYEQTSHKPKKHKKSRKAKKHAKKRGLVGHGCRGLKALPNRR